MSLEDDIVAEAKVGLEYDYLPDIKMKAIEDLDGNLCEQVPIKQLFQLSEIFSCVAMQAAESSWKQQLKAAESLFVCK